MSLVKKISLLIITLIFSANVFGQKDSVLSKIFYGLDLSLSEDKIAEELNKNSTMLKPKKIDTYGSFADTIYFDNYGLLLNDGIIESKSDSVILSLNESSSISMCYDCGSNMRIVYNTCLTRLEYYYHTEDSLKNAYDRFLKYLVLSGKKIEELIYLDAKSDSYVIFMNPYYVDEKTLEQINGRYHLIHWPEMTIKRKVKGNIFCLVIEFERPIVH